MTVLEFALGYLRGGISVVPIATDGTKKPTISAWKPLMNEWATEEQAAVWWNCPHPPGIAAICGGVSGSLECIDFDREADVLFARWRTLVSEAWPGLLERVSINRTPKSGYHVWFRCPDMYTDGNTKLATLSEEERAAEKALAKEEGRKAEYTLIETRGEGGYALVPGCPAACHSTGRLYTRIAGVALEQLPDLSIDEHDFLIAVARSLTRDVPKPEPTPKSAPGNDLRPGDHFDRDGYDWAEILQPHGWIAVAGSAGGERKWRRPDKAAGWSATTGHCKGKDGADLFHVFSSNADPFGMDKTYGKFRAFALLNCGGDLKRAAKDLAGLGFGRPASARPLNMVPPVPAPNGQPAEKVIEPFPVPIPASMLKLGNPALSWIWNGYLRRGEVTLLAALWKAGKTTLLAHLLRAMGEGGRFLGRDLLPSKVLYVTEESESRWAARRDAVGLQDHAEFLVRPFTSKPRIERWEEFIAHIGNLITERAYDVVVFDTLANLWPVRDENDASAVQASLMPLHGMIDKVALALIHHTRKSDGSEATASRGSGALTGFVDTIVEFRRYLPGDRADCRRVLTGYGRHDETPDELVIELTGSGYVERGSRESIRNTELDERVAAILPPREPGLTFDQVMDELGENKPGRTQLTTVLKQGVEVGRWQVSGLGRRGSPFLYWIGGAPSDVSISVPAPLGGGYRDGNVEGTEDERLGDNPFK